MKSVPILVALWLLVGQMVSCSPNHHKSPDYTRPRFDPKFGCDNIIRIIKSTLPGKPYATIAFPKIPVSDDSGEVPVITADPPQYEMGKTYNIKMTKYYGILITFTASDRAGNQAKCRFHVRVEDKEKPTVVFCPSNIVVTTTEDKEKVAWPTARFTDNCGDQTECRLEIFSSIKSGSMFRRDTTVPVMYTAMDPSLNVQADCKFTVTVKGFQCEAHKYPPKAPVNGAAVYYGEAAMTSCQSGKFPAKPWPIPAIFKCHPDGVWRHVFTSIDIKSLSGCTAKQGAPNWLDFDGNCADAKVKEDIKSQFQKIGICQKDCKRDQMHVVCG